MRNNNKDIENFEKLVADIEKSIPTLECIKEQANINVISIKKYFPQAYRAKRITITGAYIIFTQSMERYVSSSKDILSNINLYKTKNILVAYIYETDYIDTKRLEFWLLHKLMLEPNINYRDGIIPKKIESVIPKNINIEDIIPRNINAIRCIDNMTIDDIGNIPHVSGAYVLQFIDRECYIGSSVDLYMRLMKHKSHLSNFISGISICETQSVIDALILEGIFIKILKPKYNRSYKGRDAYTNRFFRGKNTQLMAVSKDISELLDKKMIELFNQGIFSLSIQTLAELAIKEGLEIVCDNISQILEMENPVRRN